MQVTAQQKVQITQLIGSEIGRLGSQSNVARKCGVSDATISQIRKGEYKIDGDDMFLKVGQALGYKFNDDAWTLVETSNARIINQTLIDAKDMGLWKAISHRAGSGKTATTKAYERQNAQFQVYRLACREWGKRQFLLELAKLVGLDISRRPLSQIDLIISDLTEYFNQRSVLKPLLIIDEGDKLKPAAFRSLIPIFNECEGSLGVVILGTDNLKVEIMNGVRHNRKGYDELASRFSRTFINLLGATFNDVKLIAKANGITNEGAIKKIFKECEPRTVTIGGILIEIVDDLRRVKQVVKREKLMQTMDNGQGTTDNKQTPTNN